MEHLSLMCQDKSKEANNDNFNRMNWENSQKTSINRNSFLETPKLSEKR